MTCCNNVTRPETDCTFEHVVQQLLIDSVAFEQVGVYTGNMAAITDTQAPAPTIPYLVISDLGTNNSQRIGDSLYQHEAQLRLRFFTTTDTQAHALVKEARWLFKQAGSLETVAGWACIANIPGRATSSKIDGNRWLTDWIQTFIIVDPD